MMFMTDQEDEMNKTEYRAVIAMLLSNGKRILTKVKADEVSKNKKETDPSSRQG
jgi:hypothetical protein